MSPFNPLAKLRTTIVLVLAGFALGAVAQSGEFRRTFRAGARPDVRVSTNSGDIRVTPSDGETVTVVGHVHVRRQHGDDLAERVRRIIADPPIIQSGDEVRLGDPEDRSLLNNIAIDYEIMAPREAALNLRTGSGDTRVEEVGRILAAESGSGSLRVVGVHGPVELHTGSGNIELEEKGQGGVRARTGSGSLRLVGVNGPLEAHTGSGDVVVEGSIQGPGAISSGSGSLRLRFAAGDRITVNASTGSGTVYAELPNVAPSTQERRSFQAQLNGGGPILQLRTGSGDVELKQQ